MEQIKNNTPLADGATTWLATALAQPQVLIALLASLTIIIVAWIWRKRKAEFASKRSLYGSWHAAIPRYRRAMHRLVAELERARRYHHSLTVAVLTVDIEQHRGKNSNLINLMGNSEIASQFFFSLVSSILRDNVRGSDMITYDVTNDHYVLLFPEARLAATEQALQRLQKNVLQRSKVVLRFGISEYPTEGLILQDLVHLALAKSKRAASDTPPSETAANNGQMEAGAELIAAPRK